MKEKKSLVVYYSLEGNTKAVADAIVEYIGADVLRLKPIKDIKNTGSKYLWGGSAVIMGKKPELEEYHVNLEEYEVIYIGTPVWAGAYAPAINTFINENNLSGRKIALFSTTASETERVFKKFKEAHSESEIVGEIQFIEPVKKGAIESMKEEVKKWVKTI